MATLNPSALLHRLLQENREQPWLEFKQDNADPETIGKCVSACANSAMLAEKERAFIVFGIEDETKKLVGTSLQLGQRKKGNELFANWLHRMIEPRLAIEHCDFSEDGKNFSILVVEPTYDRPVRFAGIEYIRIGSSVKELRSAPEHERALWLATSRHKFESAIALSHQTLRDIEQKLDVDSFFALLGQNRPRSDDELVRKLSTHSFIKEDMEGGFEITNLGAILFAKELSDFPSVSSKAVRLVKYQGADKTGSGREVQGRYGYAVGFAKLIDYLENNLPYEEVLVSGIRKRSLQYPITALRELIANALIHQDFTISGTGPVIEMYSDRIEIINPGNSLINVDRLIDERRSRNEKLAETMRMLGICEERGSGIDKAIIEIERKFLPAPKFIPSEDSMRAVIFGPKEFHELTKAEKIWACFCHCVIRWLQHNYMSNTTLRERFSLPQESYQAVSAVIADAKKAGRIVPADEGQGKRNARYVPYWAS